uniref:Uncharacterized protein n=1 Tax=Saimiri boliviensis boliviensis TaxID=39432 RepID=A0A2K6TIS5_SAIBB
VNKEASPLPSRCPPVSSHHDSPGGQVSAGTRIMELARAGNGVQILAPSHARCGNSVRTLSFAKLRFLKDGRRNTKRLANRSAGTWKTLRNATSFH